LSTVRDYATLTNPASVAANRAGVLSDEQRRALERRSARLPVAAVVVVLMIGIGFILPFLIGLGIIGVGPDNQISPVCAAPVALIGLGVLSLVFVIPAYTRRWSGRIREDMAAGVVEQDEGEVTFTPRGYEARLNPRPLQMTPVIGPIDRPLPPSIVPLPPGRYRFYYLPRSRTLLSAEPLIPAQEDPVFAPAPPAPDPLAGLSGYVPSPPPFPHTVLASAIPVRGEGLAALQAALAEGNRFTMEELAANREGRLTGRQARRLLALLPIVVPFGLLFVAVGVGMLRAWKFQGLLQVFSIAFALAFLAGGVMPLMLGLRRLLDALARRVVSVDGAVKAELDSSGDSSTYSYRVGTMKFQVRPRAYPALVSGMAYRIYYTPLSRTLVSIEPLSDGPT
jgi:hypothetical protein